MTMFKRFFDRFTDLGNGAGLGCVFNFAILLGIISVVFWAVMMIFFHLK